MAYDINIFAAKMVDFDGGTSTPTTLFYAGDRIEIGNAAHEAAGTPDLLNADFKIELGEADHKLKSRRTPFFTPAGVPKSAVDLTSDFLRRVVEQTRSWAANAGLSQLKSVLVAEPLALEDRGTPATTEWLANYRHHLRKILTANGFAAIEFLPEPFAAFQYYRYGEKHPLIAQRVKQNVLVIDFGGGTCDACIIETTKEGDISQTGRNSKPLAAASKPIGGFLINRLIAEEAFATILGPRKIGQLRHGIEAYFRWRQGRSTLDRLPQEDQHFIHNFDHAIFRIETPKITLCRSISDWRLDASLNDAATIALPENPFAPSSKNTLYTLSAATFKNLFIERVWKAHMRPLLKDTFSRGLDELNGAPLSLVLLSGGSANIGWLQSLIETDFGSFELADARFLPLPDYQEVVAKGLALECARRFYSASGDFSSVTYNRICLLLDPDKTGCKVRPFVRQGTDLPDVRSTPGLLLPSASALSNFIDRPMRWKVRLNHAPKHDLHYYFLRSTFDPGDMIKRYNIEENRVQTPVGTHCDGQLQVELIVKADGTARPRFIYKTGKTAADTIDSCGRDFYLEMTDPAAVGDRADSYVGLDFGTCNTAVSVVDRKTVHEYRERSDNNQWSDLTALVSVLPYPLAAALARYLAQTDQSALCKKAMEFIEAALALSAYVIYAEVSALQTRATTRVFKSYPQRSAGPLWALLRNCLRQGGANVPFAVPFLGFIRTKELEDRFDTLIDEISQVKHDKLDPSALDHFAAVSWVANVCGRAYASHSFGFFEKVQKEKFGNRFQGIFRQASGSSTPFPKALLYTGTVAFSDGEAAIVELSTFRTLRLAPLVFWECCSNHRDIDAPGHCYFYDTIVQVPGRFSFKAAGHSCAITVERGGLFDSLATQLAGMREADIPVGAIDGSYSEYPITRSGNSLKAGV